jgi:hypothetical protein
MTLPLAHLGHFLWLLYVLPVIIVVAGILRTTIKDKRAARTESAGEGSGRNPLQAVDPDEIPAPDYLAENPEGKPPDAG